MLLRERCPWDREQTHHSLVRHLVEETYEAIEAIEALGDEPAEAPPARSPTSKRSSATCSARSLFHARLAEEEGLFDLADVARAVHDKLVARHPHVFGDVTATTPAAVVANWERNKQAEKKRTHLFEGVPAAMPALARAAKVERKLASVGLGWPATGPDAGALVAALAGVLRRRPRRRPRRRGRRGGPGALLLASPGSSPTGAEDSRSLARQRSTGSR